MSYLIILYIARVGSGYGENFPDPAKRSGSDRTRIRNPGSNVGTRLLKRPSVHIAITKIKVLTKTVLKKMSQHCRFHLEVGQLRLEIFWLVYSCKCTEKVWVNSQHFCNFNPLPHGGILSPTPLHRATIDPAKRRL